MWMGRGIKGEQGDSGVTERVVGLSDREEGDGSEGGEKGEGDKVDGWR